MMFEKAPETVPQGLTLKDGHPTKGVPYAPVGLVVKVVLVMMMPVAFALLWDFGSWPERMLDLGLMVSLLGLWLTKPAHLSFLRWVRVASGRLLLALGVLLLALGATAEWAVPVAVHEIQQQIDRTVNTSVDRAKSSVIDDLRKGLPGWAR